MTVSEKQFHLNNFQRALLNVAPEYFGIPAIQGQVHMNERAFAYELYHQLRLIYQNQSWYVNGELRKGLTLLPNYQQGDTLIPDLVIHQHKTTTEDVIAVEIKSNPYVTGSQIIEDLEKLEIYTRPGDGYLNYHIGILLVINSNFRYKYSRMRPENKCRIIELLEFHRIAIWNINNPVIEKDLGCNVILRSDCLDIIRSNTITI